MKFNFIILLSFLFIFGCSSKEKETEELLSTASDHNVLTETEIAEGWELLFDGKTFKGWRGIGLNTAPEGHWMIEDNSIRKIRNEEVPKSADGQPLNGGDIITNKKYTNFELIFEWKISEGGNSGVKYNVVEEVSLKNGSTGALGFEYQVLDDAKYSENLKPVHKSASLYDMIEAKGERTKPVGEFNSARIIFNNNHGEHWLNGVKVVNYDMDTPEFEELFKKSKYQTQSDFILHKTAHIVLQDHGHDCWYRNIKIREL